MNNETDVDKELEDMLKDINSDDKSEETTTSGASDQDGESDTDDSLLGDTSDNDEDDESEQSASDRANQRIRELLKENEQLKRGTVVIENKQETSDELKDFLKAVNDAPSRELLEKFAGLMEKTISKKFTAELNPILEKARAEKFTSEFEKLSSKLPELEPYKDTIRKSYMRNSGTDLQSVAKDIVFKVKMGTVKPVQGKQNQIPNPDRNMDLETKINKLIAAGKSEEALKLAHKSLK